MRRLVNDLDDGEIYMRNIARIHHRTLCAYAHACWRWLWYLRELRAIKKLGMRESIFIMLLATISSSAMAEWVRVAEIPNMIAYTDPTSNRKVGNIVTMWTLYDYAQPQFATGNKAYLSSNGKNEYDCKEVRKRQISASAHSQQMGRGEVISAGPVSSEWEPILPRSLGEALWKFACGNKWTAT